MCFTLGLSWMGMLPRPALMQTVALLSQMHFAGQKPLAVVANSMNSISTTNCRPCDDDCRIIVEFLIPSTISEPIIIECVSLSLVCLKLWLLVVALLASLAYCRWISALSRLSLLPIEKLLVAVFARSFCNEIHKFSSLSNTIVSCPFTPHGFAQFMYAHALTSSWVTRLMYAVLPVNAWEKCIRSVGRECRTPLRLLCSLIVAATHSSSHSLSHWTTAMRRRCLKKE